ncbi:MAG: glycoside hydrolase family 95 protein [Firmicutes bacterium]|nr:glycoside hydrolase family 95 protein [Bacillota bacterium]
MKLWYQFPAKRWDQALPLGNGRLGAMVFGGIEKEHIQLNEDTLWGGSYVDRHNPDALEALPKIRAYILNDQIAEAERLAKYALTATPQSERPYQSMGDLLITFYGKHIVNPNEEFVPMFGASLDPEKQPDTYERSLALDEAIARTRFTKGEDVHEREVFISYPDDVLVIHLKAEGSEKLHFDCAFDRRRNLDHAWKVDDHTIAYDGSTGENAISFTGMMTAVLKEGKASTIGEHLIIEEAPEVTLLFTAATSFRFEDTEAACREILAKAAVKDYETLKTAHIADYKALFDRVSLSFGADEKENVPTDERLALVRDGATDPGLVAMYYQYGRYLMIACSRPDSMPANLQGIWCDSFFPIWDSKYTININTEMNYWPVETAGLAECHLPLFDLLERMKPHGQETARRMYGCRGFVAHHNTDLYADTAPQDMVVSSTYWPMGAAWLSTHIMEHYAYTRDLEFLKEHYDTLYQAVLFFKDFLIEDEQGRLVTCPSISPENTFILENGTFGRLTAGPAMDNQILTLLFDQFMEASAILERDADLRAEVLAMKDRLPKSGIGRYGQLMEWRNDYAEAEPGHRHVSQLFGVYPGNLFTVEDTPDLIKAAQATLERRLAHGGGHTGWSRAWIILLWDRFRDGNKVLENIEALFRQCTYDNLMDNHPLGRGSVFQIDGNFGATAGITEMLVQNYGGRVVLLPALPDALPEGCLKGLRLRGNASLDLSWKDGKVQKCIIKADQPWQAVLCIDGDEKLITLEAGETYDAVC